MSGVLRKATLDDVKPIHGLLIEFSRRGLLLPRSLGDICSHLRDFFVWVEGGTLIGCGALHISWIDLGEIRSLAVADAARGRGIGSQIVQRCLEEARELHIPRVFTLTFVPDFFEKLGFRRVPKETLPHKIWTECVHCPHFPDCNEVPMVIELAATGVTTSAPTVGQ